MKTLHVLISSADRVTASRIEAILRDVCFERVHVECKYSSQIADIEDHIRLGWNDLTVISPDHLQFGSRSQSPRNIMAESLRLIRQMRQMHLKPIIAFGVAEEDHGTVEAVGADAVLGRVLNSQAFRREVERVLRLPARVESPSTQSRWQFFSSLLGMLPARRAA